MEKRLVAIYSRADGLSVEGERVREVERLSLAELCGQLLVVGFEGLEVPADILRAIKERSLAGVVLFARNLGDLGHTFQLCRTLRRSAPPAYPLFVSVDQEGGRVQRLSDVLQLPPMRNFGRHDDVSLSERAAAALGHQLKALGFNLNFAPVADVDSNPDNPVIGDRSFSSDPRVVVRHARAMIRGLQAQGVIACLKHFPGHGDTALDSHLALPTVSLGATELRKRELYPFERLCREAESVMTAHVVFPAFDSKPATLSARLLSLLRREFDFDGVIFSDDLEMKALSAHWPIEDSAVSAVEAGCDALLVCRERAQHERAHHALVERAEKDPDFRARCRSAVERSLKLRRRFPQRPSADDDALTTALAGAGLDELEKELARLAAVVS